MKLHNSYQVYKQDTRRLLYWIIGASNAIIKSLNASGDDDTELEPNTTGQISISGLLSLSELIAKHHQTIPAAIYRLFQSVIQLRSAHYAQFKQLTSFNPDAEVEKSNASHKFFIDTLRTAFEVLGGEAWLSKQKAETRKADEEEDIDQVIFNNKFSALSLNKDDAENVQDDEDSSDEESGQESKATAAPQRRRQKRGAKGKGKKGKGKKTKQKRKPAQAPTKDQTIDDVPLESYRIIEDEAGIVTEYLMAVYALAREWTGLRSYIQTLWQEVAYDGLNSAVAGTISNIAVTMVKRSEATIFVDFPGHDSYETVMKTLTRGNPDRIQGNFFVTLYAMGKEGAPSKVKQTALDVREQFLIHAYQDLVDFATDFQQTRSGKPTKRMLAEISNWDPNFDLQKASEKERLKWRRSYIINWLYDLVNVFSSVVVQRNAMKGEKHLYEKVDWSPGGPWNEHRRLFGLNEFAGEVTTIAMQKPGTDIRGKIQPHLVFQLQCIIDALTVSRGWSISGLRGHILSAPAPGFQPRRDVDLFLDRECKKLGSGILQAIHILQQMIEPERIGSRRLEAYKDSLGLLGLLSDDFRDWLGESKYMYGLTAIPPSRFSNTSSNGLWEYSPFLCGVGLMESLELAYLFGMMTWDHVHETLLAVHLHNMLVKKGYLSRPVGLYTSLEDLFRPSFFGKELPTKDFLGAITARLREVNTPFARRQRHAEWQQKSRAADIHGMMDLKVNTVFKQKSNLLLYREAGWDPDRIPESDIQVTSLLAPIRISQVKHILDPVTGEWRLEDTDLVKRARAAGIPDREMLDMTFKLHKSQGNVMMPEMADAAMQGYRVAPSHGLDALNNPARKAKASAGEEYREVSASTLLGFLKTDIHSDIAGPRPLSSLNYMWVTVRALFLFAAFEEEIKRRRNPTYLAAAADSSDTRMAIVLRTLGGEDEELMRVLAEIFDKHRGGFMDHIYWEGLDTDFSLLKKTAEKVSMMTDAEATCCVM